MNKPAVFLDRDGVINTYVYNKEFGTIDSPARPDEFHLISGVRQAIDAFHDLGALLVVVSNQPGIAKGRFSPELLQSLTEKMLTELGGKIDAVYYCPHHPAAVLDEYRKNCDCRKPKPGLLLQAARELKIDLTRSVMIGDGLTDVEAGKKAGIHTIYVNPRKCYLCDAMAEHHVRPDAWVSSLAYAIDAVANIINATKEPEQGAEENELYQGVFSRSH